ncbi:MAG: hypothetical protein KG012_09550 [Deltaproteobacteria bacterium]|nr:hypothetical protein [Deltaproteobacteria bacterium]
MKAKLIFHRKNVEPNGDIIEMKMWKVPVSKDRPEGVRYSLVYVKGGKRIIGYDNAEKKGHHRHHGNQEDPYFFRGVDVLIRDFYRDVEKVRRGEI